MFVTARIWCCLLNTTIGDLTGTHHDGQSFNRSGTTDLIQRNAQANAALMRGDIKRYRDLITLTDDFTLMSPLGGTPSHATEYTPDRM
jgi:hypothetical protein